MYIVRDKSTNEILHRNAAPLKQDLSPRQVYVHFDPQTMEIGRSDAPDVPEHFDINELGEIVELSLQQQIDDRIISEPLGKKLVDNEFVEMTLSEKVEAELINLQPDQTIIGEGSEERIAPKPISQQVAEDVITLEPHQKLVGEEIQDKTTQEQIDDEILTREDVKERSILRLRVEIGSYFRVHKTPNGYRLDELARQKASFSYPYRLLPDDDETKRLLDAQLIYPIAILDEILTEVGRVQEAYGQAKQAISTKCDDGEPAESWESISILEYLS